MRVAWCMQARVWVTTQAVRINWGRLFEDLQVGAKAMCWEFLLCGCCWQTCIQGVAGYIQSIAELCGYCLRIFISWVPEPPSGRWCCGMEACCTRSAHVRCQGYGRQSWGVDLIYGDSLLAESLEGAMQ